MKFISEQKELEELFNKGELEYIPKHKIGDTVVLKNDALDIHLKNIFFEENYENKKFIKESSLNKTQLTITEFAYREDEDMPREYFSSDIDRSEDKYHRWFYYVTDETDEDGDYYFIVEPAIRNQLVSYEPRKLVYEHMISFNDFLLENLDTQLFIISNNLRSVLLTIDNEISKKIIEDSRENLSKKKITLLDINESEIDKWFFVNSTKAIQWLEDHNMDTKDSYKLLLYKNKIIEKYKSSAKIGRLINKLYPNEYKPSEIEDFVNQYKKYFIKNYELIDIVKGDDILKWYNCKRYNTDDYTTSELNKSCMRFEDKNEYMKLYSENKDKVSLVILYSYENKEKIDARALLWNIDELDGEKVNDVYFMDRIYFNSPTHKNLLINYAEKQGWLYKVNQSSEPLDKVRNPKENEIKDYTFKINNINIPSNNKFPYTDTMAYLNPYELYLTNNEDKCDKCGDLNDTGGDISGLVYVKSKGKWYHRSDVIRAKGDSGYIKIPKEDAIYLDYYGSWYTKSYIEEKELVDAYTSYTSYNKRLDKIFKSDAVWLEDKDTYVYEGLVVWSDFMDQYLFKNNAVYVKNIESYIPFEDVVKVIVDIEKHDGKYVDNLDNNLYYPTEYYHVNDPSEPFFEYNGYYFINELKKEHPSFFEK